jgi:hypothetical protein
MAWEATILLTILPLQMTAAAVSSHEVSTDNITGLFFGIGHTKRESKAKQ